MPAPFRKYGLIHCLAKNITKFLAYLLMVKFNLILLSLPQKSLHLLTASFQTKVNHPEISFFNLVEDKIFIVFAKQKVS